MIIHIHKVKASDESDISGTVMSILGSLGTDEVAFRQASEMYNYAFFRGESIEFRTQLCSALMDHFKGRPNHFWQKNSKG